MLCGMESKADRLFQAAYGRLRCKHWESVKKERIYENKIGTLSAYLLNMVFLIILLFAAFTLGRAEDRIHWQQKMYEEMRQEWYEELNVNDGT